MERSERNSAFVMDESTCQEEGKERREVEGYGETSHHTYLDCDSHFYPPQPDLILRQ